MRREKGFVSSFRTSIVLGILMGLIGAIRFAHGDKVWGVSGFVLSLMFIIRAYFQWRHRDGDVRRVC